MQERDHPPSIGTGQPRDLARQLGARIRGARRGRDLAQAQLAGRLGISQAAVSNWELGRRQLGVDDLYALADVLEEDVGALLPRGPQKPVKTVLRVFVEQVDASSWKLEFDDYAEVDAAAARRSQT